MSPSSSCAAAQSSAAGDVAGLLADVWAVLDGFRRAGPDAYSSILIACPAFDGDFEQWTREIFPALEATLLAAEASRELGIVCFHPDYATPDPKWLATHRFGHMYAPPTLRRWLEDADADLAGYEMLLRVALTMPRQPAVHFVFLGAGGASSTYERVSKLRQALAPGGALAAYAQFAVDAFDAFGKPFAKLRAAAPPNGVPAGPRAPYHTPGYPPSTLRIA